VVTAAPTLTAGNKVIDAIRHVYGMEGLTTAGAFAIAFALSRWMPIFVLFYISALVGYYVAIVRHVGNGHADLPGPSDAVDSWTETVAGALQGVLCLAVGLLPVLLWLVATHDLPSPLGIAILVVIGQLYMPAALLAMTLSNRALAVIWPPAWIVVIARAPRRYAEFAGLWLLSVAIGGILYFATAWLVDGQMSLAITNEAPLQTFGLGALVAAFVWNLFLFGQAVLVGMFLRENQAELGFER
jgi:hypothetical protein